MRMSDWSSDVCSSDLRAMLETLYSTGIRRMELINLTLTDIDADRGTLMVRQGKGKKDRMIPIGERALAWIEKYRSEEHTSELQSLMRISYAVFCLKKKTRNTRN